MHTDGPLYSGAGAAPHLLELLRQKQARATPAAAAYWLKNAITMACHNLVENHAFAARVLKDERKESPKQMM